MFVCVRVWICLSLYIDKLIFFLFCNFLLLCFVKTLVQTYITTKKSSVCIFFLIFCCCFFLLDFPHTCDFNNAFEKLQQQHKHRAQQYKYNIKQKQQQRQKQNWRNVKGWCKKEDEVLVNEKLLGGIKRMIKRRIKTN